MDRDQAIQEALAKLCEIADRDSREADSMMSLNSDQALELEEWDYCGDLERVLANLTDQAGNKAAFECISKFEELPANDPLGSGDHVNAMYRELAGVLAARGEIALAREAAQKIERGRSSCSDLGPFDGCIEIASVTKRQNDIYYARTVALNESNAFAAVTDCIKIARTFKLPMDQAIVRELLNKDELTETGREWFYVFSFLDLSEIYHDETDFRSALSRFELISPQDDHREVCTNSILLHLVGLAKTDTPMAVRLARSIRDLDLRDKAMNEVNNSRLDVS
ncbi:MAG: hypothetical protein WC762_13740 [Methylobacter sp.]|jgi:hypothetical protein